MEENDKAEIQEDELHQVAGGGGTQHVWCTNCHKWFRSSQRDGTLKIIYNGCFRSGTFINICPHCGYTWNS